jgi:hypothetical protein
VVALRGSITVASRRSARARLAAVGLVASLALGGHLAASRIGDDTEPDLAAPRDGAEATGPDDGPAGGGPLAASLTASGDAPTSAAGDDGDGGPEADGPADGTLSNAVVADGTAGEGRGGAPDGAASTTTAPAASTTSPTTPASPDPSATTTVPDGGESHGLIGGLLDLLDLGG